MQALFTRLGRFIEARPGLILAVTVLLTVLALLGVTQTRIVTTQGAFVDSGSDTARDSVAYASAFGGDPLVVMIPGSPDELTSTKVLESIRTLTDRLEPDQGVRSVISVLTALSAAPMDVSAMPGLVKGLVFEPDGSARSTFSSLFPPGHELVQVILEPGLSVDEQNTVSLTVQEAVQAAGLPDGTVVGGNPRLYSDIISSITRDLGVTAAVAVLLMIGVLYLVFPVRRRLMALPVVILGVLYTFGITGALGVSLTIVTMAGLPILLGLGMDFAIQFHNRYEEELARGDTPAAGLIDALTHIGPAVGTAVLATILGFITLSLSAVPAVRDFGALLALGVAILYVVALVLLNALLYRFDREPGPAARADDAGRDGEARPGTARASQRGPRLDLGRHLARISSLSVRFGPLVLALAVVLAIGGLAVDHLVPVQTDIAKLVPADSPGVVASNAIRDVTGSSSYLQFIVGAEDVTAPEVVDWMAAFGSRAQERHPEIVGVVGLPVLLGVKPGTPAPSAEEAAARLQALPEAIRSTMLTADDRAASLMFDLTPMSTADVATLIAALREEADPPSGVSIAPAGATTMTAAIFHALTERRLEIALAGFLAVFAGLLLVHRSWRRAVVPVVPIVLVTGWSSLMMWLLGMELNPLTAVMSALIVGIGTEFSVLLMERYWEELGRGVDRGVAMDHAVSRIGRAIAASALTVAAGFAALLASSFPAIRDFGAVTVIDVLLALVATIVVVPPLALALVRRRAMLAAA